jgi:hypothetical protein
MKFAESGSLDLSTPNRRLCKFIYVKKLSMKFAEIEMIDLLTSNGKF